VGLAVFKTVAMAPARRREGSTPSHSRHHCFEVGSFYDWLGEPVPVAPDLGIEFDVRPDDRAQEVARERDDHAFIRDPLDGGACKLDLPLDMESPLSLEPPLGEPEMARVLAIAIRAGVQENWRELRAIEEQVDSMTEAFDGEDVLHPRVRANFDEAKAMLVECTGRCRSTRGRSSCRSPTTNSGQPSSGSSTTRWHTSRPSSRVRS